MMPRRPARPEGTRLAGKLFHGLNKRHERPDEGSSHGNGKRGLKSRARSLVALSGLGCLPVALKFTQGHAEGHRAALLCSSKNKAYRVGGRLLRQKV